MHTVVRGHVHPNRRHRTVLVSVVLLFATALTSGCSGGNARQQKSAKSNKSTSKGLLSETWEACFMDGRNAGYLHTSVAPVTVAGDELIETRISINISVLRAGELTETTAHIRQRSKPNGEFVDFKTNNSTGINTAGHIRNGELEMTIQSNGVPRKVSVKWDKDVGGCLADRRSLKDRPMKPGEKRTLRLINPIMNSITKVTMEAIDYEVPKLLDGSPHQGKKLLKIKHTSEVPTGRAQPQLIQAYHWTDKQGEVVKSYLPALGQETYMTTKAVAVAKDSDAKFDLARASTVKVERPIKNAFQTKRIVYRVQLQHDDPAKVFATGSTQRILRRIDDRTAEIEVVAADPSKTPADPGQVVAGDRRANPIVESDHPEVIKMSSRVQVSNNPTALEVARALERLVNQSIRGEKRNYRQAFLTAGKVAQELEGDCTEHSVLLAALCRAQRIPARVANGLVYAPSQQGFAFHMWNEVWVNNQWLPLDATLGMGRVGAVHLKITHSNLSDATPYGSILPVMQVFRQIKLTVVSVE